MTFRSARIAAVLGVVAVATPAATASSAMAHHAPGKVSTGKTHQIKGKALAKGKVKSVAKVKAAPKVKAVAKVKAKPKVSPKAKVNGEIQRAYVFTGTFNVADSSVTVTSGNKHARPSVGQTVLFDLTTVKVSGVDTNADGAVTLADIAQGDNVEVQAKRKADGTLVASQVTDLTPPVTVVEPAPETTVVEPAPSTTL